VKEILHKIKKLERLCTQTLRIDRHRLQQELRRIKQLKPEVLAAKGADPLARIEKRIRDAVQKREERKAGRPLPAYAENLPIYAKKDEIIRAIAGSPVVVVSGETGSGKTTQIPRFCLEAGRGIDGIIGCTQPRRIAAITVASRIAEEMGEDLGRSVGYKIRFQDRIGDQTYIKIMTDGILLAEAQGDPWLNAYDTLIVDEAHERSLNIDFVLGILTTLLKKRRDLKLVVTSATIDTEKFSKAFDNAPIIEVSGRMFPVEVWYMAEARADDNDQTPVDLAVKAVDRLCQESPYGGDILVFMPTEQDIRETCELLEGRHHTGVTLLPLFARLSAADQSRVFAPVRGRKVIVATNVAETSITIPGIAYVVDTGLARISQYLPRTRTTSLPVIPVSQSSADQRMGRCGRVKNGVCIRLYSQQDYETRPRFTPPEILRSNLAEVILRMIALNLGDVQTFPFIDRPADKNIRDGFRLLEELGAIALTPGGKGDAACSLTDQGRMMARLPLDPRLSRMLIAAAEQGCLEEMTVIASALSIQDPRERPVDQETRADQAHARFKDKTSDFMTLLNIWRAWGEFLEGTGASARLRRFCKENFFSFRRMREWRDIYQQISGVLAENDVKNQIPRPSETGEKEKFTPFYMAVHQCVLTGFLSNIAMKKEKNIYKAAGDREVMIFPGSGLFNSGGPWIAAAEMVETSRVFARTAANIDETWLEPIGGFQCRYTWLDPHWERDRGEVTAFEQVSLYGLVIVPRRPVSYGRIHPEEASKIFIRSALVNGDLKRPFPFMRHNQNLIDGVKELEDRVRRRDILVSEEDLCVFYQERLGQEVYDIRTLKKILKSRKDDQFLRMKPEDVHLYFPQKGELVLYPEHLSLGNTVFPCDYRFDPGQTDDGVTVRIPSAQALSVPAEALDWLVPGLLKEKITAMVKGLPKEYRKQLVPIGSTVETILSEMPDQKGALTAALTRFILQRFGVDIPVPAWPVKDLPDHLKMRVSIRGPSGEEIQSGRDPELLIHPPARSLDDDQLRSVRLKWEKDPVSDWDFGDLPESIPLKGKTGGEWAVYPGLKRHPDDHLSLAVFHDPVEARKSHCQGVLKLFTRRLSTDLKFVQKRLSLPADISDAALYFGGIKILETRMADRLLKNLFARNIRTAGDFEEHERIARPMLLEKAGALRDRVLDILKTYAQCRSVIFDLENASSANPPAIAFLGQQRDALCRLIPEHFIDIYEDDRMAHLSRYIRAIAVRAERALVSLDKDQTKAAQIKRHTDRLNDLLKNLSPRDSDEKRAAIEDYFWLIEEYKVSLFAQELKTAVPVSPKRLDEKYAGIMRMA
jgi:ATP-dependent helicase HrpA